MPPSANCTALWADGDGAHVGSPGWISAEDTAFTSRVSPTTSSLWSDVT